jgi:hypothetical protein
MRLADGSHLTYCTNIHPGETWPEIRDNLARHVPAVAQLLSPELPFGVGLRLSAIAAEALQSPDALAELRDILQRNRLYIFTINGFPYGPFHGRRVKEEVYLPDWRQEERLRYSDRLADLLSRLLPAGQQGSISTVPGSFKPNATTADAVALIAQQLIRHAAHLAMLREKNGSDITLALEPEPCCFIETIAEAVEFFGAHLFGREAIAAMQRLTGFTAAGAEAALRRHLTLCLDLCHAAVEFEEPDACLAALAAAGIGIGKAQLSSGLRIAPVTPPALELLRQFDDGVYLHQVVERREGKLRRFVDLAPALAAAAGGGVAEEWRVHFHVPIFRADLGLLSTTQEFLAAMLARHRQTPLSQHLEVETYSWGVLPSAYRGEDIVAAIARELQWVRQQLAA